MKETGKEEIERILTEAPDGVLAFSQGETPYCIPFGFVYVDGTVYLSMFPKGRKWQYWQNNKNVCFSVFLWNADRSRWSSVVIDGELEMVTDIDVIASVVKANLVKTGIPVEPNLEKRMAYYRQAQTNPAGLKIFRINARDTRGRTMHTLIGKQPGQQQ